MNIFGALFEQNVSSLPFSGNVVCCPRTTTLGDAIQLMIEKNVGSIVVVYDDRPVGIFTERDVLKKIAARNVNLSKSYVEEYMTKNPVCVGPDTSFIKIMAAMRLGKFRHLVITNAEGKLTGVISVKDVIDVMVDRFNDLANV